MIEIEREGEKETERIKLKSMPAYLPRVIIIIIIISIHSIRSMIIIIIETFDYIDS